MTDIRRWQSLIWYFDEEGRIRCWCCLGTGEDAGGSECTACDGSSHMPDTAPCRPLCRQPERI